MTLESIVNNEPKRSWKAALVDTAAAVSFSIATGTCFDAYAGLSLPKWAKARTIMGTASAVIGRPYGKFRNQVNKLFGVAKESGFIRRSLADSVASVVVWAPIYAGTLYLAGADHEKLVKTCALQTALSAPIGVIYGWYQNAWRSYFGVKSEFQK